MPAAITPRKLKPIQLAAVIFLTVSGGPYGLESLLQDAGANAAILLLLVTPLLWDVPTILTVLELNSMMPVTGGYYQWVKRALGLRWACYEGWWTWLYTFADLAIYPVLFITYLSFFFPQAEAYKIPICLLIIWVSAGINILGIVPVGKVSLVLSALVLTPFLILFGITFYKVHGHFTIPTPRIGQTNFSSFGLGLYTVMWNFIGWDNVTTYAEEVARPVRTYLKSVFTAFVMVFLIYFIALIVSVTMGINSETLSNEGYPALGVLVGGQWLGSIIAFGGLSSTLGLYAAVLLSVSRIPKVMADDGLLPAALHRLHKKFKSPYISILTCSVVVSFMVLWSFGELVIIDISLYGAALFLEYIALIKLRRQAAQEHRPFKIPLGQKGLILMAILPLSVYVLAMTGAFMDEGGSWKPALFALFALCSAELLWMVTRMVNRRRSL